MTNETTTAETTSNATAETVADQVLKSLETLSPEELKKVADAIDAKTPGFMNSFKNAFKKAKSEAEAKTQAKVEDAAKEGKTVYTVKVWKVAVVALAGAAAGYGYMKYGRKTESAQGIETSTAASPVAL